MTERPRSVATATVRWVVLAMVVGFAALAAVFAARNETSGLPVPWNVVVPLLPFVLFVALLTPMLVKSRRQPSRPIVEAADAATRTAVNRAIRDGSTPDPRIDDLVVDLRERGTTRQLGLLATTQVVGAAALGTAAIVADELLASGLLGLAALAMLVGAGALLIRRRYLRAYRPGGVPTAEPPAAAKGD